MLHSALLSPGNIFQATATCMSQLLKVATFVFLCRKLHIIKPCELVPFLF